MKKINLRSYYSLIYHQDTFLDIPDDIADHLDLLIREEHAYYERRRVNKAFYSLDADSHLEQEIIFFIATPQEIYDRKLEHEALNSAILVLPQKQMKRLCAHFFMGMSISKIANKERVDESAIRDSIHRALKGLKKSMQNFYNTPPKPL